MEVGLSPQISNQLFGFTFRPARWVARVGGGPALELDGDSAGLKRASHQSLGPRHVKRLGDQMDPLNISVDQQGGDPFGIIERVPGLRLQHDAAWGQAALDQPFGHRIGFRPAVTDRPAGNDNVGLGVAAGERKSASKPRLEAWTGATGLGQSRSEHHDRLILTGKRPSQAHHRRGHQVVIAGAHRQHMYDIPLTSQVHNPGPGRRRSGQETLGRRRGVPV